MDWMESVSEAAFELESKPAVDDLRRQADGGNAQAAAALALRLLVGRDAPFAPEEGVELIERAAAQGEPQALCNLATLRAGGAWTRQSWPEALDLMEQAAMRESKDARDQLCIVSGDKTLAAQAHRGADGDDIWRKLKSSIDLRAFVTPKPPLQLCESPRVWTTENFATRELCEW